MADHIRSEIEGGIGTLSIDRPEQRNARRRRRLALAAVLATTLAVGAALLASPWLWFSIGGLLPTLGVILVGGVLGQLWARRTGRPGHLRYALGAAIASGALFTGWSDVSNGLFLLAGALLAVTGLSARRRAQAGPR